MTTSKVTGYGSIRSSGGTTPKRGVSGAGNSAFADMLSAAGSSADASGAAPVTDVTAASALSNLLALQEVSEEEVQRKKLVQQGNNMLNALEKLRQQLLIGTLPAHVLEELTKQLAQEKQSVTDQALMEIIEDIELRAAVEIAKLQRALESE